MSGGSVYQRADGYWAAAVAVGGKRVVRYAKTERAAKGVLEELQRTHYLGTLSAPTKVTVREWVAQWLEWQSTRLRPSSLTAYERVVALLLPHVGHLRLDRLTAPAVALAFSKLERAKVGRRTVEQAYTYFHGCIERAVTLGMLGSNVVSKVPRPSAQSEDRAQWTLADMQRFLAATDTADTRYAPLFVVLLGTGLRISEALGLRWADVDLAAPTVTVRRGVVWVGAQHSVQPPKSRAGARTLTLPPFAVAALNRLPRALHSDSPVFCTETDTLPATGNLRRALRRVCAVAGVPYVGLHGLRHAHASVLVASGVDIKTAQKRLGHSSVALTLNVYAHALGADSGAASAVGRVLEA